MGVIHVTDRAGQRHTLEAIEGWRVMEIIRDWGLPIEGLCGGACECATCHVFVAEEWLRQALSCHRRGGGPARHGGDEAEFPPLLPDPLDPRTRRPGSHPRARPARDRHPATLPRPRDRAFERVSRRSLFMTDHIETDVVIIGAGPVGLFAVFELGPPRHQMPPHRHPAESGRPMRRALPGEADLRHSGLSDGDGPGPRRQPDGADRAVPSDLPPQRDGGEPRDPSARPRRRCSGSRPPRTAPRSPARR